MKIILILFVLIVALSAGADYEKLKEYKKNTNSTMNKTNMRYSQHLEIENKYKNDIEITYHDINNMDTDLLERKYHIYLWICLGDGICIFKSKKDEDIEKLIQKIKTEEPNINTVKKYFRFEFKPL